ncbi:DMT family transporter [Microvirga aerilata]|uniref:DMT family transporter n=1 Tax=Microvirga aerilata TaxID=670292 RepID=A0A936ZAB7_9HYPH|nr:DMT family transporter [Microvirga aerilata]MBL0405941.1 DMT family transporter [Microvirga aerilata]
MSVLAITAALGASFSWAAGAMIAHAPARRLGAFEFTRTQLISSSALLLLIASIAGSWPSVAWDHWPGFATSSLVGVLLGNLAMVACLQRGGPRRTQLLAAMSAPIAMVLGYLFLGETISPQKLAGAALALGGAGLAIMYGLGAGGLEPAVGSLPRIVILGLASATCQAIGLIALKPALLAGTEPFAASALRTTGGAFAMALIALWPLAAFQSATKPTGRLILWAILPGFLGYVVAVSLLLYAVRSYETGVAAALGSVSPIIMLPMIWFNTKRRPPLQAWIGAILVVLGTGLILVS